MKAAFLCLLSLLFTFSISAQDKIYAKQVIGKLTSQKYFGRGYVKNGLEKSADYIAREFKKWKVQPMSASGFLQRFSYPVNTFPGKMELSIDGKKFRPGKDFIVSPESTGLKASGELLKKDSIHFLDSVNRVQISYLKKLTWSVSREQANHTSIFMDQHLAPANPRNYQLNIQNKFIQSFNTSNICGVIKGRRQADSLILITAHYDHLGGLGNEVYFPGANDNASGISLLLNLTKYYSRNIPDYSVGFICFSGEEVGLLGSRYFSEHPLVDLKKVRFLINLDLVGTGDDGATVVNATVFNNEFERIKTINTKKNYLKKISARGKAANSDHYWFSEKGIPSFFIYTNGGIKAYHDVYDIAQTLPLTEFDDLFRLIRDFNQSLMNQH